MGLAERASGIGDAIIGFLLEGGTIEELTSVLSAWSDAAQIAEEARYNKSEE